MVEINCEFIDPYLMNGDIIIDMGIVKNLAIIRDSIKPRKRKATRKKANSNLSLIAAKLLLQRYDVIVKRIER